MLNKNRLLLVSIASVFLSSTIHAVPVSNNLQRFVSKCTSVTYMKKDPIKKPGGTTSGHMHTFFGNTNILDFNNQNSTDYYNTETADTSCTSIGIEDFPDDIGNENDLNTTDLTGTDDDDTVRFYGAPGDTATYWIPTLMTSDNKIVEPSDVAIYYRRADNVMPTQLRNQLIEPFPERFKLIGGSMKDSNGVLHSESNPQPLNKFRWGCGLDARTPRGEPERQHLFGLNGNDPDNCMPATLAKFNALKDFEKAIRFEVEFPRCGRSGDISSPEDLAYPINVQQGDLATDGTLLEVINTKGTDDPEDDENYVRCPDDYPVLYPLLSIIAVYYYGENEFYDTETGATSRSRVLTRGTDPHSYKVSYLNYEMLSGLKLSTVADTGASSKDSLYHGHADFVNTWNHDNHTGFVNSCLNKQQGSQDKRGRTCTKNDGPPPSDLSTKTPVKVSIELINPDENNQHKKDKAILLDESLLSKNTNYKVSLEHPSKDVYGAIFSVYRNGMCGDAYKPIDGLVLNQSSNINRNSSRVVTSDIQFTEDCNGLTQVMRTRVLFNNAPDEYIYTRFNIAED